MCQLSSALAQHRTGRRRGRRACSNVCAFTRLRMARLHGLAPLPELRSLAPRALPAAQALLLALPDEVLGAILRRAWADRPPRPAAEEVRAAAGLASVCRRVRALLRAPPLPLALDFSAAHLDDEQRRWLLEPAQAGRVEAAKFCVLWDLPEGASKDALWEQPLLDRFLARHGGTLLQLSGVPLRLLACASNMARPALDLSGLRLTRLGIDCSGENLTCTSRAERLWPEYLPGALEELDLLGLCEHHSMGLAWASRSGAGVAGRLPWLHTLRLKGYAIAYETAIDIDRNLSIDCGPLLEGFAGLPHLEVDGSGAPISCNDVAVFEEVRSVRIVSGGHLYLWVGEQDAATAAERFCHARLQAAELCAERDGVHIYRTIRGTDYDHEQEKRVTRELVLEMISRFGDRFAVEIGIPEWVPPDARHRSKARLNRLAWRRWPAPGAPDLPAARAAHERARAWAAAGGPPFDDRSEDRDEEREVFRRGLNW